MLLQNEQEFLQDCSIFKQLAVLPYLVIAEGQVCLGLYVHVSLLKIKE